MRLSGAVFAAVLLVLAAGATLATAGAGSLVTSGDNGVRGQASQAPIGNLSATPQAAPGEGAPVGDVLDERDVGGEPAPADDVGTLGEQAGAGPAGAGDAGRLPFTGFLAIPVLAAGAVMLLAGVALRRRAPRSASA